MVGEVVADQGVEAARRRRRRWAAATATSWRSRVVVAAAAARARSSSLSRLTSAAATSTVGESAEPARAWISARASASPAISRRTRWWCHRAWPERSPGG